MLVHVYNIVHCHDPEDHSLYVDVNDLKLTITASEILSHLYD
jgi:hypothetical protein